MRLYVLDAQGRLLPPGITGEIHVAGNGVARGYWRRPGLTATRFLPDPFSSDESARMYKTGDLGRYRPDGDVEYLGRNDHQVKVRGFRIELGEIEAHLARHGQVKEVVVIAREDAPGETRLVAYLVPREAPAATNTPSAAELRSHLKASLPDYMVPSAYVVLEKFPLTTNGKLDRSALPVPSLDVSTQQHIELPQGEIEEALAVIWKELLRVPRVARHDDFFELGGHSLLLVQMNERLRQLGLFADVRSIFNNPSLASLANTLSRAPAAPPEVPPNLIPNDCEAIAPGMLPLVQLTAEQIARIVRTVPGGAANIQDIYPLAPLQEGILFHHLLMEQGDTYVLPTLLECRSRADLEALIVALQGVIDRHDILRSAILWEQLPRPVQVVYRRAPLPVQELKLDPALDPIQQLERRMTPKRQRFDLREAPLMRLQVAANPRGQQCYALLQLHHVASDHVAREFMIREIQAHLQGRSQELPQPIAYRNHVAQALAAARPQVAEAFFRLKLGDVDEPTAPFGLLDVYGDGSDVEAATQALDEPLARLARAQARQLRVSAATLFHAAWALVMSGTSGRDDVVFGTVLSGRLQGSAGAKRILGMFINTLPLRVRLRDISAQELVEQTQRELADLLEHEQVPLAEAKRCSGIAGSAPLFSALLNYVHDTADAGTGQLDAASGIRVLVNQEWTNYPITVSVDDAGHGFVLTARTDRRISPLRLIGYFRTALRSLVEALERAPLTPALSLSIIPADERQVILGSFNATRTEYPREKLIHELFEEQVVRTPGSVALTCEEQSLSYAELNARANQLARHLGEHGVGPEKLVGICMQRSADMVIALLAVLKAGGVYVPLDPHYPTERLTHMLADAAPRVLLTQQKLRSLLPATTAEIINVDSQWDTISQQDTDNVDSRAMGARAHNLAYVIYTSGSTGQPKGVAIEHRNAVNLLHWARHSLAEEVFEQTLFSTSLSFDLAVYECFVPLTIGGRVVLIPNVLDLHRSAVPVTLINTVPSAMNSLMEGRGVPATARNINLAGEALDRALVERIFTTTDVESICNLYGPSETTTYSTWLKMTRAGGFDSTIGRPIANTQIYVLDSRLCPVPIGVAGEIYIGGAGLARGYLNRPELTAERFLQDPFNADPHARLYKTGDLGRWRADGMLEFLGRNDRQVKLRGFRIELGEIESHLARHGGVSQAAVMLREDVAGEKRLVGYFTSCDPTRPDTRELRAYLRRQLPDHMVPSAFIALESLPSMPNGKLDRGALPAPELAEHAGRCCDEPQGDIEDMLAGIWRQVLRVDHVGREDNYFDLGGQSLLVMKLVVRIAETFNVQLPIHVAFSCPTLREMAQALEMLLSDERRPLATDEMQFEEGVL
jgi:amino acid adenylation domain-containing protein